MRTILRLVVPRTMESSISTTRLPSSRLRTGFSLSLTRKLPPEFLAALLNGTPKDYAVGPREVHVLEDAARLRRRRGIEAGSDSFRPNDDQLTRLDFTLVDCADQIEGTGFGREHDRVLLLDFQSRNASHG